MKHKAFFILGLTALSIGSLESAISKREQRRYDLEVDLENQDMQSLLEEAHYLAEQDDMEGAIQRYNIVGRKWSKDSDKAPLWLANLAGFEYKAGNAGRALGHILEFGKKYPESSHITKVIDLAYRLGKNFAESESPEYNVIFRKSKTIRCFEFLQQHDPYSLQAAEGQLAIAYIKMESGQWEEALVHLKDILRKQPGTAISSSTEVAVGECYLGMNKGAEYDSKLLLLAERYLKGYLNNAPNGLERDKANDLLKRTYRRLAFGQLKAARYYCTARKWNVSMSILQNVLKEENFSELHPEAEALVEYVAQRL